jgi:hypothetical protein
MAIKDTTGSYPGHDEGSNGPAPNAPSSVFQGGSTFAPLQAGVSGGVSDKNSLGTTGKPEGGE